MNQVILTVMKWLDNPASVSQEEIDRNKERAADDFSASSASSYAAGRAAYYAARNNQDSASHWVDRYFRRGGEDKKKYLDEIKGEESMSEWEDGIPPVGSEVVMPDCDGYLYSNAANESFAIAGDEVLVVIAVGRRHNDNLPVATVMAKDSYNIPGYAVVNPRYLKPAKTQKQKDREAFIEKVEGFAGAEQCYVKAIAGMMFDSGFTAPEGGSDE